MYSSPYLNVLISCTFARGRLTLKPVGLLRILRTRNTYTRIVPYWKGLLNITHCVVVNTQMPTISVLKKGFCVHGTLCTPSRTVVLNLIMTVSFMRIPWRRNLNLSRPRHMCVTSRIWGGSTEWDGRGKEQTLDQWQTGGITCHFRYIPSSITVAINSSCRWFHCGQ